jgi:hypothetical protein
MEQGRDWFGRLHEWWSEIESKCKRRWWTFLLLLICLFPADLVWHRILRLADEKLREAQGGGESMTFHLASLIPSTPVPIAVVIALSIFVGLAIHAYIDTRKPKAKPSDTSNLMSKLTIHSARYGTEAANYMPVSREVLQQYDGGAIAVWVSNALVSPHDPAYGIVKHLEVDYSYGYGEEYRRQIITCGENQLLVIPQDPALNQARIDLANERALRVNAEDALQKALAKAAELQATLKPFLDAAESAERERKEAERILATAPRPLIERHTMGSEAGSGEAIEMYNEGDSEASGFLFGPVTWVEERPFTTVSTHPSLRPKNRAPYTLGFRVVDPQHQHNTYVEKFLRERSNKNATVTASLYFQDKAGHQFMREFELSLMPTGVAWNLRGPTKLLHAAKTAQP